MCVHVSAWQLASLSRHYEAFHVVKSTSNNLVAEENTPLLSMRPAAIYGDEGFSGKAGKGLRELFGCMAGERLRTAGWDS